VYLEAVTGGCRRGATVVAVDFLTWRHGCARSVLGWIDGCYEVAYEEEMAAAYEEEDQFRRDDEKAEGFV
jgi:hypothetical protein